MWSLTAEGDVTPDQATQLTAVLSDAMTALRNRGQLSIATLTTPAGTVELAPPPPEPEPTPETETPAHG